MNVPLTLILFFASLHSAINRPPQPPHRHNHLSANDTEIEADSELPNGGRKELRELSREEISEMIESFEYIRRPRSYLGTSLFQEITHESSSKGELIHRLEDALNLTLPYWDFELDHRLDNPIDSVLFHSDFLKWNCSYIGPDVEEIVEDKEDGSAEHIARILDENWAARRKEALRILRRSDTNEDCQRCPSTNQWLFCDSQRMHCVSKVVINGNCTTFENNANVCHKSNCINGKCSLPPFNTMIAPTTTIPTIFIHTTDFAVSVSRQGTREIGIEKPGKSESENSNTLLTTAETDEGRQSLKSTVAAAFELRPHRTVHPIQSDSAEPYLSRSLEVPSDATTLKLPSTQLASHPSPTHSSHRTSQTGNVRPSMPKAITTEPLVSQSQKSDEHNTHRVNIMQTFYSTQSTQLSSSHATVQTPFNERSAVEDIVKVTTRPPVVVIPTAFPENITEPASTTTQQPSWHNTLTTTAVHFATVPVELILDEENKLSNVSLNLRNTSRGRDAVIPTVYKLLEPTDSSTRYPGSRTFSVTTTTSPMSTVPPKSTVERHSIKDSHSSPYEQNRKVVVSKMPTKPTETWTTAAEPTRSGQQSTPIAERIKAKDDRRRANNVSNYRNDLVAVEIIEEPMNTTERAFVAHSQQHYMTTTMRPPLSRTRGTRKRTKKLGRRKNKTRSQGDVQTTRKPDSASSRVNARPPTLTSSTKPISEPMMSPKQHPSEETTASDIDDASWRSRTPLARNSMPAYYPNRGQAAEDSGSTPNVYFSITVIEGEPRRKAFLNRRIDHCEITVTGMNMPSGYTQTTNGRLVPGTTIGLVHTLDPELHAPLVEFQITVTDRMGRQCDQRCLNDKGFYESCNRNSIRLTSHEFIAFSDPIETHESEEDVLKNQWSGRGYYRKRKKDYLLFSCAKS